jgi:hypothetical protein
MYIYLFIYMCVCVCVYILWTGNNLISLDIRRPRVNACVHKVQVSRNLSAGRKLPDIWHPDSYIPLYVASRMTNASRIHDAPLYLRRSHIRRIYDLYEKKGMVMIIMVMKERNMNKRKRKRRREGNHFSLLSLHEHGLIWMSVYMTSLWLCLDICKVLLSNCWSQKVAVCRLPVPVVTDMHSPWSAIIIS